MDELEEQIFGYREEGLTGMDERDLRRIVREYRQKEDKKKDVPFYFKERLRMRDKMSTEEGKKVYGLRKIIVEHVTGNIKANLGFREFLLRGLEKVKIEFNLVCIAHNLQKIWRLGQLKSCN